MHEIDIALIAPFNIDKEILILKRPDDVPQGGLWSFPGGKVEGNEAPPDAAMRELKEETGLSGRDWKALGASTHAYGELTLHFMLYACHCPDVSRLACESEHAWVKPGRLQEDPNAYPMPEANRKLLPLLDRI
ncbi:MAG: NUDIX domain-containing protein [Mariprofundaceae bacterium]